MSSPRYEQDDFSLSNHVSVIDFYAAARAGAKRFLESPTLNTELIDHYVSASNDAALLLAKMETKRCLLSGHDLESGQEIAACVICSQEGCPDCLDSHDCHDYEPISLV